MKISSSHIIALLLILLITWTFVSAPLPLEDARGSASIPIEDVFRVIAKENDIVRTLYTKSIVGQGKKAGLKFDEDWENADIQAGPLPALFLAKAASNIDINPVELDLFLGSHQPITPTNSFEGIQIEKFESLLSTKEPVFYKDPNSGIETAMFPDFASAMACVTCHNEHPDSPKTDWVKDEVMGATTWSYPKSMVTEEEFISIISAVRASFEFAYLSYLTEIETFDRKPEIGTQWPSAESYSIPDLDTFMSKFRSAADSATLNQLLSSK
ncbi:MAG TPA: hypothetical protein DGU45_07865 [Planctomycetes bacterium]|nr:hypothetical protein [Planctomycetota bacterium]